MTPTTSSPIGSLVIVEERDPSPPSSATWFKSTSLTGMTAEAHRTLDDLSVEVTGTALRFAAKVPTLNIVNGHANVRGGFLSAFLVAEQVGKATVTVTTIGGKAPRTWRLTSRSRRETDSIDRLGTPRPSWTGSGVVVPQSASSPSERAIRPASWARLSSYFKSVSTLA